MYIACYDTCLIYTVRSFVDNKEMNRTLMLLDIILEFSNKFKNMGPIIFL